MRTVEKIPTDRMSHEIMAEIYRGIVLKGMTMDEILDIMDLSRGTFYNRKNNPLAFRMGELVKMFEALDTEDETILKIFGRK